MIASIRSTGIAWTRTSFAPVVVSAASSAFVIAASVASAVALKSGVMRSFVSIDSGAVVADADFTAALAEFREAERLLPNPRPRSVPVSVCCCAGWDGTMRRSSSRSVPPRRTRATSPLASTWR